MTEQDTTAETVEGVDAMTVEEVALGLVAVAEVQRRLTLHDKALRAAMSRLALPGERKVAALPDGTPVGRVTRTAGRAPVARITDPDGFLAHVQWEAPTEVVTVPERREVRSSFVTAVLKAVTDKALATGALPPWAELSEPGTPGLQVGKPTAPQAAAIADAWTSGTLAPVLAIGGAE